MCCQLLSRVVYRFASGFVPRTSAMSSGVGTFSVWMSPEMNAALSARGVGHDDRLVHVEVGLPFSEVLREPPERALDVVYPLRDLEGTDTTHLHRVLESDVDHLLRHKR